MSKINTNDELSITREAMDSLASDFVTYKNSTENRLEELKRTLENVVADQDDEDELSSDLEQKVENLEKHLNELSLSSKRTSNIISKSYEESLASHIRKTVMPTHETKSVYSSDMETEGGYKCLPNMHLSVVKDPEYAFILRDLCEVQYVSGGFRHQILTMPDSFHVNLAHATSEYNHEKFENQNPKFLSKEVNLIAMESCITVSPEMLHHSSPLNFAEFVQHKVACDFANKEMELFVTGYENNIDSIIQYNKTADGNNKKEIDVNNLSYDHLLSLTANLKDKFCEGAVWLMSRKAYVNILKLRKDHGGYLMRPSSDSTSLHPTLCDYPVYFMDGLTSNVTSDTMEGETSSEVSQILFGNFKLGYMIVQHSGLFNSRDPYSHKPHEQWLYRQYVGGKIIRNDALTGFTLIGSV